MKTQIVLYLSISIALLTASAFQKRSRPQQLTTCRSLHATGNSTAHEGLAQGPYAAAKAGFEPSTFRSKGIDSINAPPCPTVLYSNANNGDTWSLSCNVQQPTYSSA